jgi:hypothetical protein
MPDYLATDPAMEPAQLVWMGNIERVTAYGCNEADGDLFARYCINKAYHRGQVPNLLAGMHGKQQGTSLIESLPKAGKLLGLAGHADHQRQPAKPEPLENRFTKN